MVTLPVLKAKMAKQLQEAITQHTLEADSGSSAMISTEANADSKPFIEVLSSTEAEGAPQVCRAQCYTVNGGRGAVIFDNHN